jgi:hypothetical protein
MSEESAVLDATDLGAADDGAQDDGLQDESQDDGAVDEATDIADGEEAAEGDEEEGAEGEEDAEADPNAPTDGRKMPDSLKKAIAALKPTSPEAAKQIKGLFFANQEYSSVFPKPADAVAAKTLIDEVGGHEGIQQIQTEREEWGQLDKSYAEGSADFVKSIAESNPEAFLKTAAHVINEYASRSPEQYGYYANTVSLNTLASTGISIDGLARAYGSYSDNPQAQAIIAEIHNSLVGLKEKTTQFEQKRTDPREEALKQKETAFEQKRRGDFEGGVASQAETYLKDKMQPEIDRVVAGRKIDPDAMKGYQKMVQDEVQRRMGDIPGFADKLEAHYRTGDAKKSVEYIQTQYNRILPEAAKVIAPYLRNIAPGKPAVKAASGTPGTRPVSAGEVVLKEMPERSAIDWTKTTVSDVMLGKAVLVNGKKATGWV